MNAKDPRLEALKRLRKGDLLTAKMPHFFDSRDRALYHELVRGVTRHRLLLDWHLRPLSKRSLEDLDASILNALRLGLYQILFLRIPAHAAVSETVEMTGQIGKHSAKSYVNAILRNFLRAEVRTPPQDDLGLCHSFPSPILKHLEEVCQWAGKSPEDFSNLLKTFNQPLSLCVRVNRMKRTREELQRIWTGFDQNIKVEPTLFSPIGLHLQGHQDLTSLPGFRDGEFVIQSEASQLISYLLGPFVKPLKILDACAAPGGKTTHLAELLDDRGEIIALAPKRRMAQNEEEDHAQTKLGKNIERLRLKSIQVIEETAEEFSQTCPPQTFDRILVDAPCTGLGTLAKHPERKWLFQTKFAQNLAKQQQSILQALLPLLKNDGILVYSICSFSLPEWQVGLSLPNLTGPPQDSPQFWKDIFDPTRNCFIFWPQTLRSEGLFAVRSVN